MSSVRTFFRHCPSCGRRFEIRLEKKEAAGSQELSETLKEPVNPFMVRAAAGNPLNPVFTKATPITVSEDKPAIVDIRDFRYTYKCKHCGHEWSEVHETERDLSAPKGYTGD